MDNILNIYARILENHLSQSFANQQNINPIALNKERFKVKGVFIGTIIFLKNNQKKEDFDIITQSNNWLKKCFAPQNLLSSIIDSADESLKKLMHGHLYNLIGAESIDISTLYETLLSIETGKEKSIGKKITQVKNYRNKLGSYYTPKHLAQSVTKKTIDTFFNLNKIQLDDKNELVEKISFISFADFSCGAGNFLIEIICYFENILAKHKIEEQDKKEIFKSIALNIFAYDVDCIALEVAKLNLILHIGQPDIYKDLQQNFVHANFLLHAVFPADDARKIDVFSSGFIYHEQLSLDRDKFKKYDIIIGNPPWEKIRFEEKKFYALYNNTIADNHFKASRTNEINKTELEHVQLAAFSKIFRDEIAKAKSDLKKSPFFQLSNRGELNTYALFTDAAAKMTTQGGVVGLVLKSAIVTSRVNQHLFKYFVKKKRLIAVYDFINRKKIFNIDSRERFCFLLLGNTSHDTFDVLMNLQDVSDIDKNDSNIRLSAEDLSVLNPETGLLPNFSTKKEADFLLRIAYRFPSFKTVFNKVKFGRIVHFTNHAAFISKEKKEGYIPIYEGKFFHQFDGKFSGFNGLSEDLKYKNKSSSKKLDDTKKDLADYFPESRFFIQREKWLQLSKNHHEKFMLSWRSLTSATNTRTCVATILPFIPASQSVQFLTTNPKDLLYLTGLFNSVVFDFILKKKLSGIDLTQSVLNQIPVPNSQEILRKINFHHHEVTIKAHISALVFLLLKNDIRLQPLNGYVASNLQNENTESRFEIIRKIDLLFMFLYELNDSELELVLSAFGKQYSKNDLIWFNNNLKNMRLYEPISSASRLISHSSPSR